MIKVLTGLDRESANPLQLHAVKRSEAANPGVTGWYMPTQGDTDLEHLGLQLRFASQHEAAMGWLIPYPIQ